MKNNNTGPSSRQLKVGENLRKAISLIFQNHSFHNPIIDRASILITEVKISPDLSNASVYISTLGGINNSPELISALNNSWKPLVGPLTRELKLRRAPRLSFILDDSFERQVYIDNLIKDAKNK
ncbi:MAG: ribosome-binding factor A [Pelagibacterales bacterium]|nr:ribosome-binding factor A [Pelagibacterales bacterium]PPR16058.1 MAG: Ribosome-binding factor A [Alphaproteobacteria bacterium MarineAlpha9_Bin3]|tara:strand:- start:682 stop:1053 length:372 start_codon:yes stop_codon:yes gene_type:complete